MYHEIKSKTSNILVRLTESCFQWNKRTATKFEGLDKKRRKIRTVWV